jgi:hypothetical protein
MPTVRLRQSRARRTGCLHPNAYRQGYMDRAVELAEGELDEEARRRDHAEFVESIRGEPFKGPPADR